MNSTQRNTEPRAGGLRVRGPRQVSVGPSYSAGV